MGHGAAIAPLPTPMWLGKGSWCGASQTPGCRGLIKQELLWPFCCWIQLIHPPWEEFLPFCQCLKCSSKFVSVQWWIGDQSLFVPIRFVSTSIAYKYQNLHKWQLIWHSDVYFFHLLKRRLFFHSLSGSLIVFTTDTMGTCICLKVWGKLLLLLFWWGTCWLFLAQCTFISSD